MRVLGLDVGEARIGAAVSDPTGTICTPLDALRRTGTDDDHVSVATVAAELEATMIVVGLPLSMDGTHGTMARSVSGFARRLRSFVSVPVVTWDERLSTAEAEGRLRQAGVQTGRNKGRVDSVAACVILESYLAANR